MPIHNFEWQLRMTSHLPHKSLSPMLKIQERMIEMHTIQGSEEPKREKRHSPHPGPGNKKKKKKNRNLETHNPDSPKHIWGLEGSKTLGTHNPESTKTESMPNLRDKKDTKI